MPISTGKHNVCGLTASTATQLLDYMKHNQILLAFSGNVDQQKCLKKNVGFELILSVTLRNGIFAVLILAK